MQQKLTNGRCAVNQSEETRPWASRYKKGCAVACALQVSAFAFISLGVESTKTLPLPLAFVWLLGGPVSILASAGSYAWGAAACENGHKLQGNAAVLAALMTPIWFMYGIVVATRGP